MRLSEAEQPIADQNTVEAERAMNQQFAEGKRQLKQLSKNDLIRVCLELMVVKYMLETELKELKKEEPKNEDNPDRTSGADANSEG